MSLNEFTYASYVELLERLKSSHECCRLVDAPKAISTDIPFYILRHDIDYSLDAALAMAELESSLGIHSTYFVLFSSPYYNIFDSRKSGLIKKIAALGHEIGLHYDLVALEAAGVKNLETLLRCQGSILGELAHGKILSISRHNPSVLGPDPFLSLPGFNNAYAPEYCRNISYYSDSCGAWRDSTLAILCAGNLPKQFQLLVHPVFWGESHSHRDIMLANLTSDARRLLDEESARMRSFWGRHSGVIEHEHRSLIDQESRR